MSAVEQWASLKFGALDACGKRASSVPYRGMSNTPIGWKFVAEVRTPNGIMPRDCYVAIPDRDGARQAIADAGLLHQFGPGGGEQINAVEWHSKFGDNPLAGEIRYV